MNNLKFRFLLVGGLNTLIGYFASLVFYSLFGDYLHIIFIAILNAIFSISISFIGHRKFVFKSTQPWLKEYIKMYIVNALAMCINIFLIWICVDFLHMTFWISQAILTFLITIYMYFAHKFFTFS